MSAPRVPVVHPAVDFNDWCARKLLELQRDHLPDLSRTTVLLPSWNAAASLRRALVKNHGGPLLGPNIQLLDDFANSRANDGPALSALECRLMLTVAVRRHARLFPPGSDSTRIGDALFKLFEELTANSVDVPGDEATLAQTLQAAYGCGQVSWLSSEARQVFQLWHAFLADSSGRSPAMVRRERLAAAFAGLAPDEFVCLAGFDELSRSEAAAIAPALAEGKAQFWLQGRPDGHDGKWIGGLLELLGATAVPVDGRSARSTFLDQAFATDGPADAGDEAPADPGITIVEASSAETEARCVELAVRQAVVEGCTDIVVLTEDRRLARRLRALLERAGLSLIDPVGWALSTSSAASLVDAWFDCVEQGFHFRPLLRVLRSGFIDADEKALSYLEKELVYRRKLERGLDRLGQAAHKHAELRTLLQRVERASRAFRPGERARPGQHWCADLLRALRELGAEQQLQGDPAGLKLIALIEQLQAAFHGQGVALDYAGFREALTRASETETFVPEQAPGPVRLMTLGQSQNLRCERLIIAGASRDGLPGGVPAQPFFNQSVRRELRLSDWPTRLSLGLGRFRRILDCASKVLLTYSSESVHDAAQPSPWIEAIEAQARRCGIDLRRSELVQLAGTAEVEVADEGPAPDGTHRPSPIVDAKHLPTEISASCHQALVDCPYKFHARYVLGLYRPEAPDEELQRKDYGEHVHRILQAFTNPVDDLPPPFGEPVTASNRDRAQARLQQIADAVFEPERRRRAVVLSWEAEFREAIPPFLDWLQGRPAATSVETEIKLTEALGDVQIKGTLDRLETLADGSKVVVDYKTGSVAKKADVHAGESVQLLHYAGLDHRVEAAEFVALKAKETGVRLGKELPDLRRQAEQRLRSTLDEMRQGNGLPANGDERACKYCDFSGLCRKGDWSNA